jgi:hypothetical protein
MWTVIPSNPERFGEGAWLGLTVGRVRQRGCFRDRRASSLSSTYEPRGAQLFLALGARPRSVPDREHDSTVNRCAGALPSRRGCPCFSNWPGLKLFLPAQRGIQLRAPRASTATEGRCAQRRCSSAAMPCWGAPPQTWTLHCPGGSSEVPGIAPISRNIGVGSGRSPSCPCTTSRAVNPYRS